MIGGNSNDNFTWLHSWKGEGIFRIEWERSYHGACRFLFRPHNGRHSLLQPKWVECETHHCILRCPHVESVGKLLPCDKINSLVHVMSRPGCYISSLSYTFFDVLHPTRQCSSFTFESDLQPRSDTYTCFAGKSTHQTEHPLQTGALKATRKGTLVSSTLFRLTVKDHSLSRAIQALRLFSPVTERVSALAKHGG